MVDRIDEGNRQHQIKLAFRQGRYDNDTAVGNTKDRSEKSKDPSKVAKGLRKTSHQNNTPAKAYRAGASDVDHQSGGSTGKSNAKGTDTLGPRFKKTAKIVAGPKGKLPEEVEQLDELMSKGNLFNVIKHHKKQLEIHTRNMKGDDYDHHAERAGYHRSMMKRAQKMHDAMDEETVSEDSVSRLSATNTKGNTDKMKLKNNTNSSYQKAFKLSRKQFGQKKFTVGSVAEDAEQIDELSKKTLGSYVKKAGEDMATNLSNSDRSYAVHGDREKGRKALRKAFKRHTGIGKAVDKLTKEELDAQISEELFEGMTDARKTLVYGNAEKAREHLENCRGLADRMTYTIGRRGTHVSQKKAMHDLFAKLGEHLKKAKEHIDKHWVSNEGLHDKAEKNAVAAPGIY